MATYWLKLEEDGLGYSSGLADDANPAPENAAEFANEEALQKAEEEAEERVQRTFATFFVPAPVSDPGPVKPPVEPGVQPGPPKIAPDGGSEPRVPPGQAKKDDEPARGRSAASLRPANRRNR